MRRVNLRGNGGGQKEATVEMTLKVRDEHEPGDYLCVNIQACDSETSAGADLSFSEESRSHGEHAEARATAARAKLTPSGTTGSAIRRNTG